MLTITMQKKNDVFYTVHSEILLAGPVIGCSQLVCELVRGPLGLGLCELLQAASWGREQFGNLEEEDRTPFEAATKQRQWRRDCGH
jgi:hypothetical protein